MLIPEAIKEAVSRGARLSVSVSGGKDSQAMLSVIKSHLDCPIEIVHADLGRAEWPQTPGHVELISAASGFPLSVVQRTKGDLVARIEERLKSVSTLDPTRPAKPFWPSSAQRYCTSDMKRDPIQKHHRSLGPAELIISCQGMRAEESSKRKRMQTLTVNRRITCKALRELEPDEAVRSWNGRGRLVLDWLPLHSWTLGDVWHEIGFTLREVAWRQQLYRCGQEAEALDGWSAHPAYVYGNERLSCALCVLASVNDLCNGKRHHPELFKRYVQLEKTSTYTFRDGFSLESLS